MPSIADDAVALDMMIVDLQGNLRGKRIPASQYEKALQGASRLPLSTQLLDIWGDDCDDVTQQALSQGDPDGVCMPALHTLKAVPWRQGERQVLASLHRPDGSSSFADPRLMLQNVEDKLQAQGFKAVVAVELEFYVFDGTTRTTGIPVPPSCLHIAGEAKPLQLYDLRVRDRLEPLLDRIDRYAASLDIPITTSLMEFGPGQIEINLQHRCGAVKAADDAVLFKRLVDRAALEENLVASFMAKPYTEAGGSGMHTHVSLLNTHDEPVFSGSPKLQHATAGVLAHLPDMLAVFAPHLNSWRRLQPDSFAPTRQDWGYDHRGVAVRLPEQEGKAARLEQRVAGADANPYLVLSLLLSAVMDGIEKAALPNHPALLAGEKQQAPSFTHDWVQAINQFSSSEFVQTALGAEFQTVYAAIKRHEAQRLMATVSDVDWKTYLPQL